MFCSTVHEINLDFYYTKNNFQASTPAVATPPIHPDKGPMTALSTGSYVGSSALSISRDSLEEGQ